MPAPASHNSRLRSISADPTTTKQDIEKAEPVLPPEIWFTILSLLAGSPDFLLTLRLVSREWKGLVNEVLAYNSAPYLNSLISHHQPGSKLWIANPKLVASRFNRWEQLDDALNFPHEADSALSPFPTGVVVLCPYFGKYADRKGYERTMFNRMLPDFFKRFGKWISTLVDFIQPKDTDLRLLTLVNGSISKMPCLRNLCMYSQKWDLDTYRIFQAPDCRQTSTTTNPWPSLNQLQFWSSGASRNCLTPILLFARFPALESLTSLEFEWPSDCYFDEVLRMLGVKPISRLLHCPQLQRLKIRNLTLEILQHFCKPDGPKLKVLGLTCGSQKAEQTHELFRGLIPLLDIHSDSLVSFTLEMVETKVHLGFPSFFSQSEVTFPHLKEFGLHLNSVVEREWWPDVRVLFRKFPNVEQLIVLGAFPQDRVLSPAFLHMDSVDPDRRTGRWFSKFVAQHLDPFVEDVVPKTVVGRLVIRARVKSG